MKKTISKERKVKYGLREKILLPVIGLFILSTSIILILVLVFSTKSTNKLTDNLMEEMNQRYAGEVQGKLTAALDSARALKPIFEQTGRIPDRESDIALLQSILEQNEEVFGVYTLWEPNAYDGLDAEYAGKPNHDDTGRFIPYIIRSGSDITVQALTGYEEEGEGDFYLVPKCTLKNSIIDPYLYSIDGEEKYMAAMVVPLIKNNVFAGIVGMDIPVDALTASLDSALLFESGYMFMADSKGTLFYHPNSKLVGTSLYDSIGKEAGELLNGALKTGEKVEFDHFSNTTGEENRFVISPVSIEGTYWLVGSTVPVSEIDQTRNTTIMTGTVTGVVTALVTAVLLLFLISKIIKQIGPLTKAAQAIETGHIDSAVSQSLAEIKSKDEIGLLANSMHKAVGSIERVATDTKKLSAAVENHDLSVEIDISGHSGIYQEIMIVVKRMLSQLNSIISSINMAAEQVSTGAAQVSSGAQALAAGSTEQASSVEELNVSITRIAEEATENSANVKTATQYVEQAHTNVRDSAEHMKQLTEAMSNIGAASSQITNITKVIEDIAFQTNILSLNAAIEAARAGSAGKGFAVVADEVRNLAAKSAEAARQTAQLIQASVATVNEGSKLSTQTAQILHTVEEKTKMVNEVIGKINLSSAEQASAIEQIRQGLNQVSSVVQTNAATAEENSATSEEMSAQASSLRDEVGKFKLNSDYLNDNRTTISLLREPHGANKTSYEKASDMGKY